MSFTSYTCGLFCHNDKKPFKEMSVSKPISEPGKMLLLVSLLAKQRVISNNSKAFLKELILRRDTRLTRILAQFESKSSKDGEFLEELHDLIRT